MTTIAAIATPPGRGGLGVIRISGNGAHALSRSLCAKTGSWTPRFAHFARFLDKSGTVIDEGLVLFFQAPCSYTGEDVVEIQAHGSPVLLNALLERIIELGARPARPGEFTRRAVENGKMDLAQAEAVAACIDAATSRAARQAQRHLQGEFGQQIEALMNEVTGLVAHLEAYLDFPDEEVPAVLYGQLREQASSALLAPIEQCLATAPFGERLFDGATAAIIGAPNVGKSCLLNRLSGRDRAIISEMPGTTRDVLEVDFEVDGIPVRLADTAGMRESENVIEQEGVRRARHAATTSDVTVFVADAVRPQTWRIEDGADIAVMNKCDLIEDCATIPESFLPVSAVSGQGVDTLMGMLARHLGDMPAGEESILVTRRRHRRLLGQARIHLERGIALLGPESKLELVALEWRQAWSALGEILGIGDIEHILDRVFSEFCIGK